MIKNIVVVETEAKLYSLQKILGMEYKFICINPFLDFSHLDEPANKFTLFDSIQLLPIDENNLKIGFDGARYIYLTFAPTPLGEALSLIIKARFKAHKRLFKRLMLTDLSADSIKDGLLEKRKFDRNMASIYLTGQYLQYLVNKSLIEQQTNTSDKTDINSWIEIYVLNLVNQFKEIDQKPKSRTIGHFKINEHKLDADLVAVNDAEIDLTDVHFFKALAIELDKQKYSIYDVVKEVRTNDAPKCFNFANLVEIAATRFDMSYSRIIELVKILHYGSSTLENKSPLLSWPFTNSQIIDDNLKNIVRDRILHDYGVDYLAVKKHDEEPIINHEVAITPTTFAAPKKLKKVLSKELSQLYELIFNRTIASEMINSKTKNVIVDITSENERYKFKAVGEEYENRGFAVVYAEDKSDPIMYAEVRENTEPNLVRISQEKNKKCDSQFLSNILDEFFEIGFNSSLEIVLFISQLEEKKLLKFSKGFYFLTNSGEKILQDYQKNIPELFKKSFVTHLINLSQNVVQGNISPEKCFIEVEKLSKYRESINTEKVISKDYTGPLKPCPECGESLIVRNGKFGKFLACSSYPKCKFTESISIGVNCPQLGCSGDVVERKTKNQKTFFGCSRFPSCKFASWDRPINIVCPQCKNLYLVIKDSDYLCPACFFKIVKNQFAA